MPILTVLASSQDNAIIPAVEWVENLLLGTLGTTIAVIAVAMVGFSMLKGNLSPDTAARVVLGAFILFGASQIARALSAFSIGPEEQAVLIYPPLTSPFPSPTPSAPNSDPYAEAALPYGR